jgi:hypothetical protein
VNSSEFAEAVASNVMSTAPAIASTQRVARIQRGGERLRVESFAITV